MARLTIIVPVYKVEAYIDKCLESILNQTYRDFKVILVDDGSPDNCGAICDKYALIDNRINVLHKINEGLSMARNDGIELCDTELITFVDSDDEINSNMYLELINYLDNNCLDIVCCDAYIVHGKYKRFRPIYEENKVFTGKEALEENLRGKIDNSVCLKVYKISMFDNIRFPRDRRYEDIASVYKLFAVAKKVGYIKKPLYYYYRREGSFIAGSFNPNGRYDMFLACKERYKYAKMYVPSCEVICESDLLKTSLSTMTAFFACNESVDSTRFIEVDNILQQHKSSKCISFFKPKDKLLWWGYFHCRTINKLYARLSSGSKRVKNLLGSLLG